MAWSNLISAVNAVITSNGNNEITGQVLRELLTNNVIPILGASKYKGIATPSTSPGTPQYDVFYLASQAGTYANFGGAVIPKAGIYALRYVTNAWVLDTILAIEDSDIVGDRYATVSNDSRAIKSSGAISFTVKPFLSYVAEQDIVIQADPSVYMRARITSYNPATGALTADVKDSLGSGTYSSWVINLGSTVPAWGNIKGTLANQTDLQAALDAGFKFSDLEKVTKPEGFGYTPPFDIYYLGEYFAPDPAFNLEDWAAITVNKTYYVDSVNGNDGNAGTEASPLKTLIAANNKGDADQILIAEGSYFYKNQRPTGFSRSMKIKGLGTLKSWITSDVSNTMGTFSLVSNHYEASSPDFVANCFDFSILDAYGRPQIFTKAASIAEVDSTPNSFFWSASTIYVRTQDDRPIDSDIKFMDSLAYRMRLDNATQYFENVQFFGGVQFQNNTATGGAEVYLKNVKSYNSFTPWGLKEFIFDNVELDVYEGDGFNYDARNGIATKGVEINCKATNRQVGDGSSQASTGHNNVEIISINGIYYDTAGQNVGDVLGTKRWMLGSRLARSLTGVGFYVQDANTKAWLDRVRIYENANAITQVGASELFYNNLQLDGGAKVGTCKFYF